MLKRLFFKNEFKQMERLMRDNVELQGIVLDQIQMIRELEDKNSHLDFQLEDTEIQLEHVKEKLRKYEETEEK
jgi:hypothetical protein